MERNPTRLEKGPMRLYVGSLHFNITEDMLRGIFEPFGSIQTITLMMDYETGRSKGYGFVTYEKSEDAKKALEQMNGFELAGRPMKVGHVTEGSTYKIIFRAIAFRSGQQVSSDKKGIMTQKRHARDSRLSLSSFRQLLIVSAAESGIQSITRSG